MIKGKRAFTLVELVMVIVLLGIIAGASIPLILAISEGWVTATQTNEISESAKIAIDRIVREIRRIKDTTSIIAASSSAFTFVNIDDNTITFNASGSELRRTIDSATNILADNISVLSFTYYDGSGSIITTPVVSPSETNIRRIEVNLTFSLGSKQLKFNSGVSPRRIQ